MNLLQRRKIEILAELNRMAAWVPLGNLRTHLRNDARGRRALRDLVREALARRDITGRLRITGDGLVAVGKQMLASTQDSTSRRGGRASTPAGEGGERETVPCPCCARSIDRRSVLWSRGIPVGIDGVCSDGHVTTVLDRKRPREIRNQRAERLQAIVDGLANRFRSGPLRTHRRRGALNDEFRTCILRALLGGTPAQRRDQ
jgi:hypothetical protein